MLRPTTIAVSLLLSIPTLAQSPLPHPHLLPPDCVGLDLHVTARFFAVPGSIRIMAVDVTNPTRANCTLQPDGNQAGTMPLAIAPGETAHTSLRWLTLPTEPVAFGLPPKAPPGCTIPLDQFVSINGNVSSLMVVSPTLLSPVCSPIRYASWSPGPFQPDWKIEHDHLTPRDPSLLLTSPKPTYDRGEDIPLHLALTGLDPSTPATRFGCPILFRTVRDPSGFTRLDEITPTHIEHPEPGFSINLITDCTDPKHPAPLPDRVDLDLDPGYLEAGPPDRTFTFFALAPSSPTGELPLVASNALPLHFQDPATLDRTWGPTRDGVRVDLTLDKRTYTLGEDIPLHIAAQVLSGTRPVYSEPDTRRLGFDHPFPQAFHLTVTDTASGPVGDSRQPNLWLQPASSGGPIVCPDPVRPGELLPLEASAKRLNLLPQKPGTYRIVVSWSPFLQGDPACNAEIHIDPSFQSTDQLPTSPPPAPRPFTTVFSNPVLIQITPPTPTP